MSLPPVVTAGLVVDHPHAPPRIEEFLLDPPGPGEVLVRMEASGLCHTDLMVAEGVWWDQFPYRLGHEGVGVVEVTGDGVDPGLIGGRVLLAWRSACGSCRFCNTGRQTLCVDMPQAPARAFRADGTRISASLRVGAHARHTVVSAHQLIPVPQDIPAEALCVIGCGVLTGYGAVVNTADVTEGRSVLVTGCGSVGLNILQAAALRTGGPIIAVDTSTQKRELAMQFGATAALDPGLGDVADAVRELTGGHGVDFAFDAVGTSATAQDAVKACDVGGTCVIVGTPARADVWALSLGDIFHRRLTIKTCTYGDVWPERDTAQIIQLYRDGRLALDRLVSEVVPLAEAPQAMERLAEGYSGVRIVLQLQAV